MISQSWFVTTLAGSSFALFVALVIYVYRWMDAVKDNHLTHIQSAVEKTAALTSESNDRMKELAIREDERHRRHTEELRRVTELTEDHYQAQTAADEVFHRQQHESFAHLKDLIRTRGL
jgi:hypothetical protein